MRDGPRRPAQRTKYLCPFCSRRFWRLGSHLLRCRKRPEGADVGHLVALHLVHEP